MTSQPRAAARPDPSWRSLYRAGGWCGILAVLPYLAAIVVVSIEPPPIDAGGAETLRYIADHRTLYLVEQVLWLAPGALLMVLFLAIAVALKDVDKSYAAIAGLVGVSSWALTLALPISGGGSPVLISLSDRYAQAATTEQRDALAAAAEGLIAENDSTNLVGVLTAAGILLVSLVMLKGGFPRWTAFLGVATGTLGVVSETFRPVIGSAYAAYGILLLVWLVVIGRAVRQLARTG